MNISMFGAGYAGLVSGVCFSEFGNRVTMIDADEERIEMLKSGRSPVYEYGLEACLQRNIRTGRIVFSTDLRQGILHADVIFIAVGTPATGDGGDDLRAICEVAETIGIHMDRYKLIVNISTVPVGTAKRVAGIIRRALDKRGVDFGFDMASNPGFLREGRAMEDFFKPQRVLIGTESERARAMLLDVYRPLVYKEVPFVFTDMHTAEMAKYASNTFLAMKVTFMNELANLCEKLGANVQRVAEAMGADSRIGPEYLCAGPGYGGSCFPRDVRALSGAGRANNTPMRLLEATMQANEAQKQRMVDKIQKSMGVLPDKRIAVLGLTFKPETDDMREAPSLHIVENLAKKGACLRVFDPQGMDNAREAFDALGDQVAYAADAYEAAEGCDAVVLLTEWDQFAKLNLTRIKESMRGRNFFDFRNVFNRKTMEDLGFIYEGVGV
ncbi:MAG: UDP-glucose dehydrogenase family protein [Bacillota bacterium]